MQMNEQVNVWMNERITWMMFLDGEYILYRLRLNAWVLQIYGGFKGIIRSLL